MKISTFVYHPLKGHLNVISRTIDKTIYEQRESTEVSIIAQNNWFEWIYLIVWSTKFSPEDFSI